jgi:hypothetical protein
LEISKVILRFRKLWYVFWGVGGDVWRWLCRHGCRKIPLVSMGGRAEGLAEILLPDILRFWISTYRKEFRERGTRVFGRNSFSEKICLNLWQKGKSKSKRKNYLHWQKLLQTLNLDTPEIMWWFRYFRKNYRFDSICFCSQILQRHIFPHLMQ